MPSKNSKARAKPKQALRPTSRNPRLIGLWRDEPGCDEQRLAQIAFDLAQTVGPTDRIFLEGPLGAGKSTFARAFLAACGIRTLAEGSPTFAIVHTYAQASGITSAAHAKKADLPVISHVSHADLYRLEETRELESAGIEALLWPSAGESEGLVLMEWASKFPDLVSQVERTLRSERGQKLWRVDIQFEGDLRSVRVFERERL